MVAQPTWIGEGETATMTNCSLILVNDEQLVFETLLADISASFVGLSAGQVDGKIQEAQRRICECLGIEHSVLWQSTEAEPGILIATHLYREPGLPARPDQLDAHTCFPWAHRTLQNRQIICLSNTADVTAEATTDKNSWRACGIKSTLAFPLAVGEGPVFGVLSFDATTHVREWPQLLVKRLQILAQVFANALTRKRMDEEARLRHTAIVESCNDAIISMNLQGAISDWNTAAEMIYGYSAEEAIGQKIDLVIPPELHDEEARMLTGIGTGENIDHYETIRLRKDGKRISVSLTLSPMRNSTGRIVGASKIARDITEGNRDKEDLQKSYQEIRQLKEKLQTESDYLQEEIKEIGRYEEIVGQSRALREVLQKVEQVAQTDSIVLITGESGTGKELIARALHERSKRRDRPMVKVDCASLPSSLIESELFGREKGAYTGALTKQIGRIETADGSTLFLDEIGELGVEVQAKLLRVVQDGEFERLGSTKTIHVNLRIIAATHRNLAERVKNGTFREDLFYRLNVFPITVPPLRERLEDIPLLVVAFLREFEKKMSKTIRGVTSRMMDELKFYPWPGNIRELRNVIERAVIITTGERLNLQLPKASNAPGMRTLKEAEIQHILSALEKTRWRIKGPVGAAMILGMKPSTLYTKMRLFHIPTRHEKSGLVA
jgi:formate hydrogenlyase transcriptional activator